MIDEARDLNPCLLEIVEKQIQSGKQIILVGDTYQHIYDFTGAVDAMPYIARKYREVSRLPWWTVIVLATKLPLWSTVSCAGWAVRKRCSGGVSREWCRMGV